MAKGIADAGGVATGTDQEKVQDKAAAGGEELVIRAPVHCDGCARKLRRSLQRIEGVGEVSVDSRTNTVVVIVRGHRAVEKATEVVQVVQRKTGEKALLVSPSPEKLPPPSGPPKDGGENNKKDDANTKDVGNDLPAEVDMEMVTVLKMNLHCDGCSEEIKRRILKITGVEEAVPHLKSSQMMLKGKVEPATLVGFIHKCTGRKAAIIRAEPLDDLLQPQSPNSPAAAPPPTAVAPAPPVEAESKNDDAPSENAPGEKNGRKEEPNEESKGGGEEDHVDDENPETEKPGDGGGHGDDGVVLENHTKDDRLFTVPMPAGVVTVAPEMALITNRSYCYPPGYPYAQNYYPYYQQYGYPQAYPAYACSPAPGPAAMYGYGYGYPAPANYPPEAFCEENPNACTIV